MAGVNGLDESKDREIWAASILVDSVSFLLERDWVNQQGITGPC